MTYEANSGRLVAALHAGFLGSAEAFPERPALEVGGNVVSYRELKDQAMAIAATLVRHDSGDGVPLTAVFAHRSATAFAAVLGTLFRGHGYVPLNRRFPANRSRMMLERAGCRAVVVDRGSAEQLAEVIGSQQEPLVVLLPDHDDVDAFEMRWPQHRFFAGRDIVCDENDFAVAVEAPRDAIAYLLFTSGSTGLPKGVMVAHRNVTAFVDVMVDRYGIGPEDRFSQTFDLTFDLSVFDMFVAWQRGACVCCPSNKTLIKPGGFIRDSRLSVWFSVPSTGVFMKRFGMLKPGRYPDLRWSLFCGEPLPVEVARSWAAAAPNSIVENLYGPTELTIACTLYRWDESRSAAEAEFGIVPIGYPYPGMRVLVVDEELRPVPPGSEGELLMTGDQLTLGYWHDREKTQAAYVRPTGEDDVFYRTGDRVKLPDDEGPLLYRGRVDHQIKILGIRVELGEVEAVVREESRVDAVVALGWPLTDRGADGIIAFIGDESVDVDRLREAVAQRLPEHMVPRQFVLLPELPLNPNGKFDRRALQGMLESATASA
jgi:amino acid adenylation domain-containing protein